MQSNFNYFQTKVCLQKNFIKNNASLRKTVNKYSLSIKMLKELESIVKK